MNRSATLSRGLLSICIPVYALGVAAVGLATASVVAAPYGPEELGGLLALLAVSLVAERFPVPVHGADAGGVSLSFVFGVAAIVLYGWRGVAVAFLAPAIMQLAERRPPLRVGYNASAYAISAAVAAFACAPLSSDAAQVAVAATSQYALNVLLVCAVLRAASGGSFAATLRWNVRWTAAPFAFMGSTALALVSLWTLSPLLAVSLAGPLLAITLYQRSTHRVLQALRLASTDPLTGVGNHRHFHECLGREFAAARAGGRPLSLCLVDVDDFKGINDRFGHPAGDHVLASIAGVLRRDGSAFRLGGDEFALLLPARDAEAAAAVAESVARRVASLPLREVGGATVSVGVAAFPAQAADRDELIQRADDALYAAKAAGKNRAGVVDLAAHRAPSRLAV